MFRIYALCLIVAFHSGFAQCSGELEGVFQGAIGLKNDMNRLFNQKPKEHQVVLPKDIKAFDDLIVRNQRVSNFYIKDTKEVLDTQIKLSSSINPYLNLYSKILPLAYTPKRTFYESEANGLIFAFLQKTNILKEIFVQSSKFKTPEGFTVGHSIDLVLKSYKTEKRSSKDLTFYVGEGITFVVKDSVIDLIVVFSNNN